MIHKTLLRWLLSILALVAISIAIILTPLGLTISLKLAKSILPGELQYDQASGIITGAITLKNLRYYSNGNTISIAKLRLKWSPLQLIHQRIVIKQFKALNVKFSTINKKDKIAIFNQKIKCVTGQDETNQCTKKQIDHKEQEKETLLNIPYKIKIDDATINQLTISNRADNESTVIENIHCQIDINQNNLDIQSIATLKKPFPLTIKATISGSLTHYKISVIVKNQQISWHLHGSGNQRNLSLHLHEGKTLQGQLSFNSDIRWTPYQQWHLQLQGKHLNFSQLDTNWPQRITIKISTQGKIKSNKLKFMLNSTLRTPKAKIDFNASKKEKLNASWNVTIEKLTTLYKKFSGSIKSKGKLSLSKMVLVTSGNLCAKHFSIVGYRGNTLNSEWGFHSSKNQLSFFKIMATNFQNHNIKIDKAEINSNGSLQLHKIKGKINIDSNNFLFQITGKKNNRNWIGNLKKLVIQSTDYRNWELTKSSQILLSKNYIAIKPTCLKATKHTGQLCIDGNWSDSKPWRIKINSKRFYFGLFTHLLLNQLTLSSPASLQGVVSGKGNQIKTIKAYITLHPGQIGYSFNGNSLSSPLQKGSFDLSLKNQSLIASGKINLSKNNTISIAAKLPKFLSEQPIAKKKIAARITANFNNLDFLTSGLQALAKPSGKLLANLSITGNIKLPEVSGRAQLDNGQIFIPRLGITLKKINTQFLSIRDNQLQYKVTAYSEDRPLQINGKTIISENEIQSTNTISANNILILKNPEYVIYATPKIKVDIKNNNIYLSGNINIPKGVIQPHTFTNIVSLPTEQIIYTAGEPFSRQTNWSISADLEVNLGNNVKINTSGFNAAITGQAKIIGRPKKTTLADGQINIINGKYSIYGKTLVIASGSFVQFINSPINNPFFNIRATRQIKVTRSLTNVGPNLYNLIVGIELRGNFRRPKIIFFSIPATLSQADIVSYLILGTASQSVNGSNLNLLIEATNALNGNGAGVGGTLSQIKQGLGLTELGVETQTLASVVGNPIGQQSAFVIGKNLTKNIYIRYSIGLGQNAFAPVNIFRLRYTLDKHWSIQTDSSSLGSGGDAVYSIETD